MSCVPHPAGWWRDCNPGLPVQRHQDLIPGCTIDELHIDIDDALRDEWKAAMEEHASKIHCFMLIPLAALLPQFKLQPHISLCHKQKVSLPARRRWVCFLRASPHMILLLLKSWNLLAFPCPLPQKPCSSRLLMPQGVPACRAMLSASTGQSVIMSVP